MGRISHMRPQARSWLDPNQTLLALRASGSGIQEYPDSKNVADSLCRLFRFGLSSTVYSSLRTARNKFHHGHARLHRIHAAMLPLDVIARKFFGVSVAKTPLALPVVNEVKAVRKKFNRESIRLACFTHRFSPRAPSCHLRFTSTKAQPLFDHPPTSLPSHPIFLQSV